HQALRTVLSLPQSQALALKGTLDDRPEKPVRETLQAALSSRPALCGFTPRVPLSSAPGAAARRVVAQSQVRQSEHGLNAATDTARLEVETAWTQFGAADEVVTTQEKALELERGEGRI